jgi:Sel1 repeat-containing protein
MCGRELEPEGALVEEAIKEPVAVRPAAAAQGETSKAAPAPAPTPAPAYTGGIFNLGAPAEQKSRNLDYLLEDDEPRSHRGPLLFVVALALVVGLGYLRFRQTGIPGFRTFSKPTPTAASNTPPASPQPESAPTTTVTAPAPSTADQTENSITPVGEAAPPATPSAGSGSNPAAAANTPPASAPTNPASANSAPASEAGGAPPAASQPADKQDKASEMAADKTPAKLQAPPAKAADQEAAPATNTEDAAAAADAPATPKPPKKAPKPPAAKPDDPVVMGEKYLYGRGVPQSCEKGLRYVKPAAEQSNPKAMITMGALYATGHCLSRDLPTAYRYFALALRKDPENSALKQNAEMVWGQMTPSERQLAIRLTQ